MTLTTDVDAGDRSGEMQLRDITYEIALEFGVPITDICLHDGREMGCLDTHIFTVVAGERSASTKIHHEAVRNFSECETADLVVEKIRNAIKRLQKMLAD